MSHRPPTRPVRTSSEEPRVRFNWSRTDDELAQTPGKQKRIEFEATGTQPGEPFAVDVSPATGGRRLHASCSHLRRARHGSRRSHRKRHKRRLIPGSRWSATDRQRYSLFRSPFGPPPPPPHSHGLQWTGRRRVTSARISGTPGEDVDIRNRSVTECDRARLTGHGRPGRRDCPPASVDRSAHSADRVGHPQRQRALTARSTCRLTSSWGAHLVTNSEIGWKRCLTVHALLVCSIRAE